MSHAITWFEIPVTDLDRAMRFYTEVTQRQLQRMDFGVAGEEDAVFETADPSDVKGALLTSPHAKPSSEGTRVYLNVGTDLDACLARVTTAGGSIVKGKTALPPGMGCFAHIIDSEGNRVGLHASD